MPHHRFDPRVALTLTTLEARDVPSVGWVTPQRTMNDPLTASQWALSKTQASTVFDSFTGTGQTILALVDTGLDLAHPDLAPNLWTNPGEVPGNGIDDDRDGYVDDVHGVNFLTNNGSVSDPDGHGTHVAGIAGARGDNGVGTTGIDPRVRLMPLQFMNSSGGTTADAARAIDYAVAHGARIINCSWGGAADDANLAAAIGRAQAAGVIVVAASGNVGSNNDSSAFFPANYSTRYSNVVSVTASTQSDSVANYANTGARTVTIAAPGDGILSTLPGNRYGAWSGTSMAAPQVAGALALLWDRHPDWSASQVIAKLKSSVDTGAGFAGKVSTGGRLSVAKLLDAVPSSPPPVATPPAVPPPVATPPATGGLAVQSAVFSGVRAGQFDRVVVRFNRALDPMSLSRANFTVSGPNGPVAVSAVLPNSASAPTQLTLVFRQIQRTPGSFQLTVSAAVKAQSGAKLGSNASVVSRLSAGELARPASVAPLSLTRVELPVLPEVPVTLRVESGNPRDWQVRLVGPGGQRVLLADRGELGAKAGWTAAEVPALKAARAGWALEVLNLGREAGSLRLEA